MDNNVINENKNIERKRPAQLLRNLEIGQTESFIIRQMLSVRQTILHLQKMEAPLKFSTRCTEDTIEVTRIA